jgi:hypothetical protein
MINGKVPGPMMARHTEVVSQFQKFIIFARQIDTPWLNDLAELGQFPFDQCTLISKWQ